MESNIGMTKSLQEQLESVVEEIAKEDFVPFTGGVSPVAGETYVQLNLSNNRRPIELAETFNWSKGGRGTTYPHILGWREATKEEFEEYQDRKAKYRVTLAQEKQNKAV